MSDVSGSSGGGYGPGNPPPEGMNANGIPTSLEIPYARQRTLHIIDGATPPNNLEITQVYIPYFITSGFPPALNNLNGLLCGGFWVDKYQACQPEATRYSGGPWTDSTIPTYAGSSCKYGVIPWTDISWQKAKEVCWYREGLDNSKSGTCTQFGTGSYSEFYVQSVDHLVGNKVYFNCNNRGYVRRVVDRGSSNYSDPDRRKYVRVYPPLPEKIYTGYLYSMCGHHLMDAYEWFSLAALAYKYAYLVKGYYNGGNTDYGKDIRDTRSMQVEGIFDPTYVENDAHQIYRVLTGSGPNSWCIIDDEDRGVMDLVGNVWEWTEQEVAWSTYDGKYIIHTMYPGGGTEVPATSGYIHEVYQHIGPDEDGLSLASFTCLPWTINTQTGNDVFNNDYYWAPQSHTTFAVVRGGAYWHGHYAGPWCCNFNITPTTTSPSIGFRGCY